MAKSPLLSVVLTSAAVALLSTMSIVPAAAADIDAWYGDPSSILEDLGEFSAIYVKAHGCVWSEYGIDNFDDDGENRDGDEDWYQGRTTPFRANVAYSLYGIKKGFFNYRLINKCAKATYINTYVTFMGADALLQSLGRTVEDVDYSNGDDGDGSGHTSCAETDSDSVNWPEGFVYSNDDDDGGNRRLSEEERHLSEEERRLSSGSGDEDTLSTTLGCAVDTGSFVMAVFGDGYCSGGSFINTTADDVSSYNNAMSSVTCEQVDLGSYNNDDTDDYNYYGMSSLLESSSSCDSSYYGDRCPDPYGKKAQWARQISKQQSAAAREAGEISDTGGFARVLRGMSWFLVVSGMILFGGALWVHLRFPTQWKDKFQEVRNKFRRRMRRRRQKMAKGAGTGSPRRKSPVEDENAYSNPDPTQLKDDDDSTIVTTRATRDVKHTESNSPSNMVV